mmetsp:Transcript_150319/g.261862  ORF Transcript_150319/g.261862 Transcript_150319/m.261862 type:complete len:240 (-) Transcript_150319:631-1350(-)
MHAQEELELNVLHVIFFGLFSLRSRNDKVRGYVRLLHDSQSEQGAVVSLTTLVTIGEGDDVVLWRDHSAIPLLVEVQLEMHKASSLSHVRDILPCKLAPRVNERRRERKRATWWRRLSSRWPLGLLQLFLLRRVDGFVELVFTACCTHGRHRLIRVLGHIVCRVRMKGWCDDGHNLLRRQCLSLRRSLLSDWRSDWRWPLGHCFRRRLLVILGGRLGVCSWQRRRMAGGSGRWRCTSWL